MRDGVHLGVSLLALCVAMAASAARADCVQDPVGGSAVTCSGTTTYGSSAYAGQPIGGTTITSVTVDANATITSDGTAISLGDRSHVTIGAGAIVSSNSIGVGPNNIGANTIEVGSASIIDVYGTVRSLGDGMRTTGQGDEAINPLRNQNTITVYSTGRLETLTDGRPVIWFQDVGNDGLDNTVINNGVIRAGASGTSTVIGNSNAVIIRFENGATGIVQGNLDLGGGSDLVVLRGGSQFLGSIRTGGGDDIVNMYKGATFSGGVDGGDGANTLSLLGDAGDPGPSSLIPGSVSNFSAINKGGTSTWTILGSVSGLGSSSAAINVNQGTLVLSGNNDGYQGTTTIAAAGTLQIGDGGSQGDLPGAITNNGVLTFNRAGTLVVPGAITGTGLVRQVGLGDVTLTGPLTDVSLTVEAGRLTLAAGSTLTTGGTPAVPGGFATAAYVTGGTLANAGTITANRTANQDGVRVDEAALVNSGTITASASGVFAPRGATLTNTGAITGFTGVFFGNGAADRGLSLTGNGSITGTSGDGIHALNVASDVTLGTLASPLGAVTGSGGSAINVGVTGTSAIGIVSGGTVTGGNGRGLSTSAVLGATTITQTAGTIAATGDGVNATSGGGAITIDLSGGQIGSSTTAVGGDGIGATQGGAGALTVTSGAIHATGIGANLRNTGGGAGDVALTANGSITAANGSAIVAQSNGSGNITLTTAAGATLSAGLAGNAAVLAAGSGTGAGFVQVTNNATITRPGAATGDVGINVRNNDNGGGGGPTPSPGATLNGTLTAIAVTNAGTITDNFAFAGILARANSAGVVSVTNSGTGIIGGGASGIAALNAGAGGVSVANAGRIAGGAGNGIVAQATGAGGGVTVSNTNTIGGAGTPVSGVGITASIADTGNAGTVSVDGAGVINAAGNGIDASTAGTGALTLGGATPLGAITSGATGINAAIANASSTAALGVTSAGLITAGSTGIGAATVGGGTVTVTAGPVTTSNGSGIVATGKSGAVAVTANGAITAGGTGASGVFLTGGNAGNSVTVAAGQTVQGAIGLRLAGGGTTTLSNGGSIVTSAAGGNAIQIDAGRLILGAQTGTLTGNLAIGGAGGALTVDRAANLTLANTITGAGTLDQNGTGRLTLTGANGADSGQFTGTVNVNAGTLAVNGTFGDTAGNSATVNVNSGGTLHGSGLIAGSVNVASGATVSAGNSPGTLTVAGNYGLTSGATSLFELGTPNVVGGATNDLIEVGGNLTLAGTLRLVDSANAAAAPVAGTYRLYNYGGTLSGSFGTVSAPTAMSAMVYTTIPNQVNLFVFNAGQVVQYWDGADTTGAGAGGQGGTAVWNGANTNWTASPTSTINAAWASGLGIFAGTAGTVTVAGAQNVQGLQFTADGYQLTGAGTLNLTGDPFSTPTQSFVNVDGGVGVTIANALTSTGGTIGLNKIGNGTLTLSGSNTYTGATSVTAGTLVLAAGGSLTSDVAVASAAAFTNAGTLTAGLTNAGTAANSGTVTGTLANSGTFTNSGTVAGLVTNTAGTLTNTGTLNGGATITGGTLALGVGSIVNGALVNAATVTARGQINGSVTNGAGAAFTLTGPLTGITGFANEGTLSLAGTNLSLGTLTGTGAGAVVQNGGGTDATLTVGSGNASGSYAGILRDGAGPGRLLLAKTGSGTLALTGTNSASNGQFTGTVNIDAGTLAVNGTFGDTTGNSATVNVNNGGTLQGSGLVAGSVFVNGGGTVAAGNPLTVGGNYTVAAGSNHVFRLGTPNVVGGTANDLITVGGALAINGGTASLQNVSASGLYRLYDVGGAVTTAAQPNAGFDTVTATNGTASIYAVPPSGAGTSQVNARVSLGGQVVQYWDGTDLSGLAGGAPGAQGGSGVWNATNANWTDDPAAGQVNQNWQGQFGVFTAPTAGGNSTVTVEGRQNVQGLQFSGNGYTLTAGTNGSLNLTGDPNGVPGFSTVRVDNGVSATIEAPITGAGLNKAVGSGTLILTGANSFGALTIADGTVEVRGGAAILDTAPVTLGTMAGAGLVVTDSETIGSLAGGGRTGGTVVIAAGQTLTTGGNGGSTRFDGSVGGAGALIKTGSGTFTLTGANTFGGGTTVAGGTLVNDGSLAASVGVGSAGAFVNNGTLAAGLANAGTSTNTGTIAGGVTNTAGTLTNTGTLNGGATVAGGTLVLGAGSLVNGALANAATVTAQGQINGTVANGADASFTLTGPLTGITGFANEGTLSLAGNNLALGTLTGTGAGAVVQNGGGTDATLTVGSGNVSGSYAGILRDGAGPGRLLFAKTGSGTLTLSGANTYTGATSITAGTLVLAAGGALTSDVAVASAAAFTNAGTLTAGLTNAGTAANSGTVAGLVTNTAGTLTNTGTLNGGASVTGGTLALGVGSIVNGALVNAAAVTARGQINGTVTNGAGASVTLTGPLTGITGFANEGTLSLSGNDLSLGTLTGTGAGAVVQNGGSTDATLTVGSGNASGSYAGILRDGAGPGRLLLAKTGSGTLTLTGANTYTGATTVGAGLLQAGAANAFSAASAVTVASGATLDLAGNSQTVGSLAGGGAVTLGAGTLSAGADGTTTTFSGLASGTGGLTKVGTGTLTLSGANRYTGATTASAGQLVLLGSVAGPVVNGARFDNAGTVGGGLANTGATTNTGTITGAVTNSGALTTSGTLAGGLTNTGTVLASAGRLDGAIANAGTLAITGTVESNGTLTNASGATLSIDASGRFRVADLFSNAGAVSNAGALTADVTNAAGARFSNSGTVTALSQPFRNAGTLVSTGMLSGGLANTGLAQVSGRLDGALANAGTLTLTGTTTGVTAFTNDGTADLGGTALSVGSLSGTRADAVLRNGRLITGSDNTSTRYAGTIADGAGATSLTKVGSGTLTLSGASTYTGATLVNAGTLALRGTLDSAVTVAGGAELTGSGSVGGLTVLDGASVGPGGAGTIGTLSVAGNVRFAAGSLYRVDATAAGQADRITASGTATLQGGTVQVTAGTGAYVPRTRYTLLSAAGGLTGQFAGVSSNFAFLTPFLSYDANDVTLTLARNDLQFASVAATRNQNAVAGAVQAAGVGTRLYDSVAVLSGAQARQAFDALSGEIHASAITAQFSTANLVREAIFDRLRFGPDRGPGCAGQIAPDPRSRLGLGASSLGQACAPVPAAYTADRPGRAPVLGSVPTRLADPNPVSVWGQGFGAFGSVGSNGNAARLAQQTSGFVLGADSRIDGTWRLGVAGGYTYTSLDVTGRQSTGAAESGFGALYAGASYEAFQLRLGGAYTGTSLDMHRSVTFAGFSETASARYGGALGQAFGEVGYRIASGAGYIEPFVGGAALRITRDGFAERGGAAALTAAGSDTDVATSTIGVQAQGQLDAILGTNMPILVRGLVGYRRAYGDVVPSALFTFGASGQPFLTAGVPIARDALVVQGGVDWQVRSDTTLSVAYSGQIGSERTQDHGVKGSFLYRW